MRAVVQRVSWARVSAAGREVARTGPGFLVLVGVGRGDTPADVAYLAEKVAGLRICEDARGKMNLAVTEVSGEILAVSQFTLYADCRKGRRPSFTEAAPPEEARALFGDFVERLRGRGLRVLTGAFGEHMLVELANDGPVTIVLDSSQRLWGEKSCC
ncbi:MAG TPA: D-tyrosyl-tRNA(Tyr) deacylase [Firmicutes bacterium]|nr:D-tyrosyl-tRNA(Tyr) deacylase [Bacillota bacterium]